MIDSLEGKTALITGAASGIGLECARRAAGQGMHLILVDWNAQALSQAQSELQSVAATHAKSVRSAVLDVSNSDAFDQFASAVLAREGAPHLLMNNAGVASAGLIWEHSAQDWERVLGVNVWGVINGVKAFVPSMLEASRADPMWRGHIINTASMAGLLTPPNMGIYNVSKHAVVAYTETLYQDLKLVTTQLCASVLCPYFVPTAIHESFAPESSDPSGAHSPSRAIGHQMLQKALSASKVSAAEVALRVFEALGREQFYIFSHPHALGNVELRMRAIVNHELPPDPFALRPELGQTLRDALT